MPETGKPRCRLRQIGQVFACLNVGARSRRDHVAGQRHVGGGDRRPSASSRDENVWTRRLVLFLRIMAVLSMLKGLYHWAQVTGFIGGEEEAFENQPMAWQAATVYFAVIELVAAVGLWLATPWGAVVWLTTVVSMAVIELMFPGIYGGSLTGGRGRSLDAGGLSRARLDGGARTAAIGIRVIRSSVQPHGTDTRNRILNSRVSELQRSLRFSGLENRAQSMTIF